MKSKRYEASFLDQATKEKLFGTDLWLNAILENNLLSIMVLNSIRDWKGTIVDFEFIFLNRKAVESVHGRDLAGKRLLEEFPEVRTARIFENYVYVVETGRSWEDEIYLNSAGTDSWAAIKVTSLEDGVLVLFSDISAQKKVEQELLKIKDEVAKRATDKYLSLFNNIDQGFCIQEIIFDENDTAVDYRFLEVNPVFEKQTGLKNAVGHTIREFDPSIESFWLEKYGEVVKTGKSIHFEGLSSGLAGGVWYDVYAFRIDRPEDRHVAVLFNDITSKKKGEENFLLRLEHEVEQRTAALIAEKHRNIELKRMNELMDTFVYAAAHDLKAPVSNLRLLTDLITDSDDNEFRLQLQKNYSQIINTLEATISGLVRVLEIEKDSSSGITTIRFDEVLKTVLKELFQKMNTAGTEINADFSSCETVNYVDSYLVSIFRNMVSNALKYRSPGKKALINIRSECSGKFVLLTFSDNGIGIDLEHYGNDMFKPFKRFSSHNEGSGLGLHLVKSIVTKNGGRIEIESKPCEGTTFRIFIVQYSK